MNSFSSFAAPFVWACSAIAAVSFVVGTEGSRGPARRVGALVLFLAALVLVLHLALPQWLPVGSAIVHPDGTTEDPRVVGTLLLGIAALLSLVPLWRRLAPTPAAALSQALPGIMAAGLFGAVASFARLSQPMAIAGLGVGAFGFATAIVLTLAALRRGFAPAAAFQALATHLIVVAAMLSLHGARATGVSVDEGGAIDTLGHRVVLARVDAPRGDQRVLDFALVAARDSTHLRAELRGAAGSVAQSFAAAQILSGPVIVPIALEERRPRAHDLDWVDRNTPLTLGGSTLKLAGFRFVKADTIRLYADLDVTTGGVTQRISPGMYATPKGEIPFAAEAPGLGPIAVARIDADHGRAGLVLPRMSETGLTRVANIDLRLRPALPVAWLGLALALMAMVFALTVRDDAKSRA